MPSTRCRYISLKRTATYITLPTYTYTYTYLPYLTLGKVPTSYIQYSTVPVYETSMYLGSSIPPTYLGRYNRQEKLGALTV